jgi:hypothetical protein
MTGGGWELPRGLTFPPPPNPVFSPWFPGGGVPTLRFDFWGVICGARREDWEAVLRSGGEWGAIGLYPASSCCCPIDRVEAEGGLYMEGLVGGGSGPPKVFNTSETSGRE